MIKPTFQREYLSWAIGKTAAGLDEVGRGALAGPVVAGCVILPPFMKSRWVDAVRDSKLLTTKQRAYLSCHIMDEAQDWSIGVVATPIIDKINILRATKLAMEKAVLKLKIVPEILFIDGNTKLTEMMIPQESIIAGDKKCMSIACASIIAKVTRDDIMKELDKLFPRYYFGQNNGYGTKKHLDCLEHFGVTPAHRHSFSPISKYVNPSLI